MVQSTSTLNPYTNPDGALARRNLVLDTMIENVPDKADELRAAKQQPLGILPQPNELPRGCIAAGDRAFFCDYVAGVPGPRGHQQGTGRQGRLPDQDHARPRRPELGQVGRRRARAARPRRRRQRDERDHARQGRPTRCVAMASNRTYGLNTDAGETMQPQPFSLVGDGAGSIFKIFTTAAALDMGMGINAQPRRSRPLRGQGAGQRRREGLPDGHLVRAERGQLPRFDERHRRAGDSRRTPPSPS